MTLRSEENSRRDASADVPPPPPRPVPRWFFVRRMQGMVFAGLFLPFLGITLGVVCFFVGGGISPTVDYALDRRHAQADGRLIAAERMTHTHIMGKHPWRVRFEFTPPGAAPVEAVAYSLDDGYAGRSRGDELTVEYDPGDPRKARPADGRASLLYGPILWILAATSVAPILIGDGVLLAVALQAWRESRLLAYGVGVEAAVVHVRRCWHIHFGRKHPLDVFYEFVDHERRSRRGRDRTYCYEWAEGLRPGDTIGVVYQPYAPDDNVLWLADTGGAVPPVDRK